MHIVAELLWALRRAGLAISTAEAIDLFRAYALLGFADRDVLVGATEAILGRTPADVGLIRATFGRYFSSDAAHGRDSLARLKRAGFGLHDLRTAERVLRDMLTASGSNEAAVLLAVLAGGPEIAALLRAGASRRSAESVQNIGEIGYFAEQLARSIGVPSATKQLALIRGQLAAELGRERADALLLALEAELREVRGDIRSFVEETLAARVREAAPRAEDPRTVPFATLTEDDRADVERAVRLLAERLRGGAAVTSRRQAVGPLDPRRTLRRALATGGLPLALIRRTRRPSKPRLWVLCDVSDSVRSASTFLLAFLKAIAELFTEVRAFVFVAEIADVTALLRSAPFTEVVSRIASGAVVSLHAISNYGRVLTAFEAEHAEEIGRRDILVILGDGRTHHRPPRADVVERLRDRSAALFWLCPEPVGSWGVGDSAMRAYENAATLALPASSARDLEQAARRILRASASAA